MRADSLTEATQPRLAAALLDPAIPVPRRFDVHRNTMMSSLVRALADGFPSIERLVGPAFFAAMAAEFVRAQPPSHPVLLAYGAGFAGFLERFDPVAHLPWLADVARLDGLRRRAWHAADVPMLNVAALNSVDPEQLAEQRIALHPSVGVLGSVHPARTLWAAQNGDESPLPIDWAAETAAVWRSGGTIHVDTVDAALLALLDAARRQPTLAELLAADSEIEIRGKAQAFATALGSGLLVDAEALVEALARAPDATLFDDFIPFFPATAATEASP
jgi:hypothetical protein